MARGRRIGRRGATGLQVSSAMLAGRWRIRLPASSKLTRWISAAAEKFSGLLGPVNGYYTDGTPITGRGELFEDVDNDDPWQECAGELVDRRKS
jgi:homospermidine synthase